ncbi:MAG: hypothetical protein A2784_03350 [Candidatus Chisholmbacteria bacterium RIFCSPHIGHO2_01_FULL_48_12]|uniref:Uncharacterized protein n=1 Tax=Candidatus Chisholmbacteria bacterium RIFCSPHIGHO2_01_FULL_48_12 TaxID=1797589 RepID=A0A1G1VPX8_9BACT|nr:MAG: hypothetical protein A2784_03350 [Candidatus Chisholmbacteria bacterium RIFCSPHIGHO2_01_FULL_48_12]
MSDYDPSFADFSEEDLPPPPDATESFVGDTLSDAAELLEQYGETRSLSFARGLRLLKLDKTRDIYLDSHLGPWGGVLQQIVDGKAKREAVFELARSLVSAYGKVDFIKGELKNFPANPHAVLTMAVMFLRMADNRMAIERKERRIDDAFRLVDVWSKLNKETGEQRLSDRQGNEGKK